MVRKAICCVAIALFAAAIAGSACAGVAGRYEVVPITANGVGGFGVMSLTNSGVVCGYGNDLDGKSGLIRYNVNTGVTEFNDQMSGFGDSNNAGAVAGFYKTRNGESRYCVWSADGSVTEFPLLKVPYNADIHINDAGKVLGNKNTEFMSDARSDCFVWNSQTGMGNPAVPSAHSFWNITDMNNKGYYLGRTSPWWDKPGTPLSDDPVIELPIVIGGQEFIDAIWSEDGAYYEVGRTSGYGSSPWRYINDLNQVAGDKQVGELHHVMRWDPVGGMVDVTAGMDGNFCCHGLNNTGQMLLDGYFTKDRNTLGSYVDYIWDPEDGLVSIQDLVDPASGLRVGNFRGFNDKGWILAGAYNPVTHRSFDAVLRPVTTPEPSSVIAMFVGFVGLAGIAKKRGGKRW